VNTLKQERKLYRCVCKTNGNSNKDAHRSRRTGNIHACEDAPRKRETSYVEINRVHGAYSNIKGCVGFGRKGKSRQRKKWGIK
jgi:hypothetical protein